MICGLSGGVDSSVAALLVHRAVGDRLTCVFVDHGLMRKNEGDQVIAAFRDHFKVPLVAVDAEDRFLDRLQGVSEPEAKRKAIGAEFIRVFEEEAAKIGDARYLVQGTLYSDVIESGGGTGRGDDQVAPQRRRPARGPRVQARGAAAGVVQGRGARRRGRARAARSAWWRQPFPGPGLAIRVVGGEATKERLDTLRNADHILQDEIRKAGLYRELWQSFCVLPDIRTVGVQGDERTYGYVVAIRAVTSDDAMTADWARLPASLLEQIASRMINEIREVNRVVLDMRASRPARSSGSRRRRTPRDHDPRPDGAETPWDHEPRPRPGPGGLSRRAKIAAGAFIAILYAGGMGLRGDWLPGIVGGILAGIVLVMVLNRIEQRRRQR